MTRVKHLADLARIVIYEKGAEAEIFVSAADYAAISGYWPRESGGAPASITRSVSSG